MSRRPPAPDLGDGSSFIYLLHGDETFLSRRALDWLRGVVLDGAVEDFNLDRFDTRDHFNAERVVDAARTLPMMAARRMIVVKHAERLFADKSVPGLDRLIEYVKSPDDSTCLVFAATTKVKKNMSLYKAVAKHGVVYEAAAPYERELPNWAIHEVERRGRTLRIDAAAFLIEIAGRNLTALDAAIERLTLYVDDGAPISLEDVEACIANTRARTVWELVDAVADRNAARALARAHTLSSQGEPALRLLAMVIRHFRQLLVGRTSRADGGSPRDWAARAGVPPFRAQAFARQLDRYEADELLDAIERLNRADRALKRSPMPDDLLLESVLLDLCAPRT